MCGAHAQVNSAAELSIALRLGGGVTRADVREDRALVKTFGPRGTVHLLPGRDLPWWTAALSAVPRASNAMPEPARMTDQQTERVVAAIGDALLAAGRELTVDELSEQVIARTGTWAGDLVMPAFQRMWPRWRQAISLAGRRGVLCFGRSQRGRKVTYTHPRRLFPGFQPSESEEGPLTSWSGGTYTRTVRLLRRTSRSGWRPRSAGPPNSSRPSPRTAASRRQRSSGAVRRGSWQARRYLQPTLYGVCGCCPTSTRTSSRASPVNGCSRDARTSGHWQGARLATSP
jgi:hypothetical protein